jgi:hypothetical protein
MGESQKNYAKLTPEQQREMIEALKSEASGNEERNKWARTGLYYLDKSALSGNQQDYVNVDETLVYLADAEDQLLRKFVALSFNFWDGDRAEATLLKLANDKGHGTLLEEKD